MANVSVAQHKELRKAARRIRDHYPGARVILFGSAARGTSGNESDVDLCVVIDHPDRRPLEIGREIRREIRPIVHGPLDLLVYDSAVFRDRAAQPVSFEAEIEEEGEEL
jgi:predicted nucleotidyltransferase